MQIWLTLSYFIQQLFDAYGEVTFYGYSPENHLACIEQTHKLVIHLSMMNPDEEHDEHQHSDEEHNNIMMFILKNTTTF